MRNAEHGVRYSSCCGKGLGTTALLIEFVSAYSSPTPPVDTVATAAAQAVNELRHKPPRPHCQHRLRGTELSGLLVMTPGIPLMEK